MLLFFNVTATAVIYTYCHTLSLRAALPISAAAALENPPLRSPCAPSAWRTFRRPARPACSAVAPAAGLPAGTGVGDECAGTGPPAGRHRRLRRRPAQLRAGKIGRAHV